MSCACCSCFSIESFPTFSSNTTGVEGHPETAILPGHLEFSDNAMTAFGTRPDAMRPYAACTTWTSGSWSNLMRWRREIICSKTADLVLLDPLKMGRTGHKQPATNVRYPLRRTSGISFKFGSEYTAQKIHGNVFCSFATVTWKDSNSTEFRNRIANRQVGKEWKRCCLNVSVRRKDETTALHDNNWKLYFWFYTEADRPHLGGSYCGTFLEKSFTRHRHDGLF